MILSNRKRNYLYFMKIKEISMNFEISNINQFNSKHKGTNVPNVFYCFNETVSE